MAGIFSNLASMVWRDFPTDGVPSSGEYEPEKSKIRLWGTEAENAILAQFNGPSLLYTTRAALYANLTPGGNATAWVWGDATAAYNGVYYKTGASGAGSWTRAGDLPYSVIPLIVTGGTANAIEASSALPLPQADGAALFVLTPTANATASATLTVNGVGPNAIAWFDGANVPSSVVRNGVPLLLLKVSSKYRLPLTADAAAQAEAAAASATAAATSLAGANTALASATTQAANSLSSANAAAAYLASVSLLAGISALFNTKALADAGAGSLAANAYALVLSDETNSNRPAIYQKVSGAMTFRRLIDTGGLVLNVRALGAVANNSTDDRPAIQAVLDAAGAAGGGPVYMPAGIYYLGRGLSVPSNVHLFGDGRSTELRYPAGTMPATLIGGVNFYAAIAMGTSVNARVSNLFVNLRANATQGNGIQIGEYGASSRAADCTVEDCIVYGWNWHSYLIYVKLADRCKIRNNIIRGVASGVPTDDLTGIEIFGSDGTEVCGNNIANCGDGMPIKSENKSGSVVPGSYIRNLDIHDNVVDTCVNGIVVGVAKNTDAGGTVINCDGLNVSIHDNVCTNMSNRGLVLGVDASAVATNFALSKNTLKQCSNGNLVIDSDPAATTQGFLIQGNVVIQSGGGSTGISLIDIAGADVVGNSIYGTPYYAVAVANSSFVNLISNVIAGSQRDGIYISGTSADVLILSNSITGYGASVASPGAKIGDTTVTRVDLIDNFFRYGAASSGAYAADFQLGTYCQIAGNRISWVTNNAVFVNGTNGRNNYGTSVWDRNANRVCEIFPREVGFGLTNTDILTDYVDISGFVRMRNPSTPASATAAGAQGQWRWDGSYVYVCVATNTWKRAALSTW